MSLSTEVQRTLVKSPPELWSELSNPEALARHLSGLGEIRITSVEPETKVEWESEDASGVVQLKQSGWGTKVTLSMTRGAPAVEETPLGAEAIAEPVAAEPEPVAAEPEPVAAEPDQEPSSVEPEPQLGFFARLFHKRRAKPIAAFEPEPEIEVVALAVPEPIYPACLPPDMGGPRTGDPPAQPEASEPAKYLASELELLEAQMAAETTELLTGVLDRLGAAHHRPFSRG